MPFTSRKQLGTTTFVMTIVFSSSCTPPREDAAGFAVRDSAGIRIVENHLADSSRIAHFVADVEPSVRIGTADGDPAYTLGGVVGAKLLSGGRIAIADRMATTIRVYDSTGQHLDDWGRSGQGPGEYGMLWQLAHHPGDSLLVTEIGARRLTVLSGAGVFGRVVMPQVLGPRPHSTMTVTESCCRTVGTLTDGHFVFSYPEEVETGGVGGRRSTKRYIRVSPDGQVVDTIAAVQGPTYLPTEGRGQITRPHLSAGIYSAVFDNVLYVAAGDEYVIRAYDANGTLRTRFSLNRPLRAVTSEAKAAFEALIEGENFEGGPDGLRRYLDQPYAETFPEISQLHTDSNGNLWVTHDFYLAMGHQDVAEVFAPTGEWIRRISVPAYTRFLDADAERMLVLWVDEFDIPQVRLFRLRAAS